MLYLVKTDGSTEWSDLPSDIVLDHARRSELDVNRIPWEPAERKADVVTVRLALRHGVPAANGIVVRAVDVANHDRAESLVAGLVALKQSGKALEANDQIMESIMPGWIENGRKLESDIETATMESIQEAEDELARRLEHSVNDELVQHWRLLGGFLPDPL